MNLTVDRKAFVAQLQTVTRAIAGRSTLPILSNVLIEANNHQLRLAATDLEIGIEQTQPAGVREAGAVTVAARLLTEIAAGLTGAETVTLRDEDRTSTTLTCGRSTYRLLGLSPEEFPPLPEVGEGAKLSLTAESLALMLRCCLPCASEDETRPTLTGVQLRLDGRTVRMAATDTHRLAMTTLDQEADAGKRTAILPHRALEEVDRLLKDADRAAIRLDANQALFEIGATRLTTRLIEGQFPNVERVIPGEGTTHVSCEAAELLEAVKRVALVAKEGGGGVDFQMAEDRLLLSAVAGTVGEAHEEVEAVVTGEPLACRVGVRYLLDFARIAGRGRFEMGLTQPLAPIRITVESAQGAVLVLMPMNVV